MMKSPITQIHWALTLALLLTLLCTAALPAAAGASTSLPADWQTIECGGLALSLPPEWELSETFGIRIASLNPNGGGPRANATILASLLYVEQAEWDEETYRADISDGIAYNTAQIESYLADPIGDWPAVRTVLTAEDDTDTYLLYEAIVATGAEEGVRISCVCSVSVRDELEETFAQIIGSIRKLGENAATLPAEAPEPGEATEPAVQGEALTFTSDALKLSFELPAGWTQIDSDTQHIFLAPDGSGTVLVTPSDTAVTPEMVAGLSEEILRQFMVEQVGGGFTNIENLFFAKATGASGDLYLISAYGCMAGEAPYIYAQYFYTATDGTLTVVTGVATNDEAGAVTLNWFDQMIKDNIPADVYAELGVQIGM